MPHIVTRPGVLAGSQIAGLLALVHAANDILMAALGVLLPTLQAKFDATPTVLAILVAAAAVSSSATQPFIGVVAERLGLRQVLAAGLGLAAVSISMIGIAGSVPALIILLVAGGVGSAALHPTATSIVGSSAARNPGLSVGLFTAGGMAGFAFGPAIILWFVRAYGLEHSYWLMVPGLVAAAVVWWVLPDWEPHALGGQTGWKALKAGIPRLWWLVVSSMLVSLVFLLLTSAVPLWLVEQHRFSPDHRLLGWVLGATGLAAAGSAVLGGVLGGRFGYRSTTVVSLLAGVPTLAALVWLPVGVPTVVAAAVLGGLLYLSQPLLVVRAQELVPEAPAAAAGMVLGFGTGLAGVLYIGMGALQSAVGLTPSLIAGIALLVLAAYTAHVALRSPRSRPR